jgi:hypothetical protein
LAAPVVRRYGARRGCHHAWEEPSERDPVGGHLRHGWIHGRSHQTFSALTVPENRIFVLTDVIVFPLVEKSDPDFVGRYRIEEHAPGAPIGTGSKFQYNTVGTGENWSQHFTSGIKFAGKTEVTVVNTTFSTGRTGFQLLGYFTEL